MLMILGSVPRDVDKDTWSSSDFFHIYFNMPSSLISQTSSSSVTTTASTTMTSSSSSQQTLMSDESSRGDEDESFRNSFGAMVRAASQRSNGQNGQRNNNFLNIGNVDSSILGNNIRRRGSQERNSIKNSNVISAKLKLYKIGRSKEAEVNSFKVHQQ